MITILDTDHCVEVLRGRLNLDEHVDSDMLLCITAITVGELVFGAYKSDRPEHHLAQVKALIEGLTLLPYDHDAGYRYGHLKDTLRRSGQLLAEPDLQIASIALSRFAVLATHNQRHFRRVEDLNLADWL